MVVNKHQLYANYMLNRSLSKILLGVVFTAAADFLAEVNNERKLRNSHRDEVVPPSSTVPLTQHEKGEKYTDYASERSGFGTGLLTGSVIGSLVGAGLALWYAPQAGKRTQAMMKREAARLHKQVNKKATNLYSTAEEIASEAAERASDLTEQGREFIGEKANKLKKAVTH